jgi:hypothetical protein
VSAAGEGAVFSLLPLTGVFEVFLVLVVCLDVGCDFFDRGFLGDFLAAFLLAVFAAGFRFAAFFLDALRDVLPAFFTPRLVAFARRFDGGTATAFALRLLVFLFLAVATTYSFMT